MMKSKQSDENRSGGGKQKGKLALSGSGAGALLSHEPQSNTVAIGQTLTDLTGFLESIDLFDTDSQSFTSKLKEHHEANQQFVDPAQIERVSCPHSIKKWAFERMPELKIPYEVKNRLKPSQIEENADEHATMRLLDLAEDFLQITSFCRTLQGMQIEMSPHAAGMEFIFEYMGPCDRIELREIEDKGLNLLFKKFSRENSMRLRANVSDEFVEIQVVVFKKQLRLGMSPTD